MATRDAKALGDLVIPSGVLAGRVVGPQRQPLAAASLRVIPADVPLEPETDAAPLLDFETSSSQDGTFRIPGLPPGTWHIVAVPPRGAGLAAHWDTATVPLQGESAFTELQLPNRPYASLILHATRPADGLPVENLWCDLFPVLGASSQSSTSLRLRFAAHHDSPGTLRLTGIPAGTYQLEFGAFGHVSQRRQLTLAAASEVPCHVQLPESGALRWNLTLRDGTPASGAECLLEALSTDSSESPPSAPDGTRIGRAGDTGEWAVRGLAPGSYRVTAEYRGMAVQSVIQVRAHNLTIRRSRFGADLASE